MNCLRSLTYKRFIPTLSIEEICAIQLWIAYDLWLTRDLFQRVPYFCLINFCCELLTIFDLQEIYSNEAARWRGEPGVVNCLRSLTYKRFIPTQGQSEWKVKGLWIAYDLWLTRDLFQQSCPKDALQRCCELLTIFDLQEIYSNVSVWCAVTQHVVNCLRSLTYKRFIPT